MDVHENQGRSPEKMKENEKVVEFVLSVFFIVLTIFLIKVIIQL